jgi:two-component system OmpR family response regulator
VVERILVVDDNPDERRIFGTVLYYNGYEVLEAGTGMDAVAAARDAAPQLILMDVKLPDMTGFLAAEIINTGLNLDLPVICVTGLDITEAHARERGCVDLLIKPVSSEDLVRSVRRVLDTKPNAGE